MPNNTEVDILKDLEKVDYMCAFGLVAGVWLLIYIIITKYMSSE